MYSSVVIITILLLNYKNGDADNKFMNTVRNMTNSNNSTKQNEGSEGLRRKFEKYLGECRNDGDSDYSDSSEQRASSDPRGFRKGPDGATYPAFYGSRQQTRNYYKRSDNGDMHGYLTNYGEENTCNNRRSFNNGGQRKNDGDNYDQNRNFNQNRYDPRRDNDRTNRDFNDGFPRWKRNYNDRCVSQCIFSYLELLDENRSPSESAFIQFLQENVSNDRERLKVVREARRCFAKFVTTEEEDGCEFSKSLSKCLRLNLD